VELDSLEVSALRRAIAKVKQLWSVIGWVTKKLTNYYFELRRASEGTLSRWSRQGRHVKHYARPCPPYILIYHSRYIPEEVTETFQILLQDTHIFQNDLAMRNTADIKGGYCIEIKIT
jgi:hypothetical protein